MSKHNIKTKKNYLGLKFTSLIICSIVVVVAYQIGKVRQGDEYRDAASECNKLRRRVKDVEMLKNNLQSSLEAVKSPEMVMSNLNHFGIKLVTPELDHVIYVNK